MKNTIFLAIAICISTAVTSQVTPFLKLSLDGLMLIQGPHPDNPNYSDSSLDVEVQVGVEFNRFRVSTAYQSHKEINYSKYTFLMVDYRALTFPIRIRSFESRINCYIGLEWSSVTRKFDNPDPSDPYNYKAQETSMWHYGANAEIQWMFTEHFGLASHINFFRAEPSLVRDGKDYRWEVMVGGVVKL